GNTSCLTTESHHDNLVVAACVMGKAGYHTSYGQIFDLDATSASTIVRKGNYNTVDGGVHTGEGLITGEAFVPSYVHSTKPAWFAGKWPLFDPNSPTLAGTNLPAGFRMTFGFDVPTGPVNLAPIARAAATPTSGAAPL